MSIGIDNILIKILSFGPAGMILKWTGLGAIFGGIWDNVKLQFKNAINSLTSMLSGFDPIALLQNKSHELAVNILPKWVSDKLPKPPKPPPQIVDLSGSMAAQDFTLPDSSTVDRLEAVKYVLAELAQKRKSDRLGLIVFGSAAFLQTPFTEDHLVWEKLLTETEIGMAGQSTVFGDAIGLSIKLFNDGGSDNRVLIVLTDGNDTGSTVPPIDAAKVAAANDIRIYTIATGDPATIGEEAMDIKTIERVSEVTGGQNFQALNREELIAAYSAIGDLEPELYETISFRPKLSLHYVPIAIAAGFYWLYHAWSALSVWRRGRKLHAA